ncbi:PIN domain-containing protein [Maridesulfovibrio ferrireducens]|uniref:PIN domain-containing protein n=1 Tax=Maridesulfovibrio ferrireducens TaxID=246191 RepID=UPI001A20713A|nr:PIN domain-containing protein [Maridesulfovibrio ferrireducens]MBI9110062.1 DUF4935 domain-containing protein [Maridesulfovibrio ferrireducens]
MPEVVVPFAAISIDNDILKKHDYNFLRGILKQLEQFAGNKDVEIIQTDIVHKESVKHLAEKINGARSSLDKSIKDVAKYLQLDSKAVDSAFVFLSDPDSDELVAEKQLAEFYNRIGAEVLESDSDTIDVKQLVDMYFSHEMPFEKTGKKKEEFPDAISLLRLEWWAEELGVHVIAVSRDGGWLKYGEGSKRLTVVDDLAYAMSLMHEEGISKTIEKAINAVLSKNDNFSKEIDSAIESCLDGADIAIEFESSLYVDYFDTSVNISSHVLQHKGEDIAVSVVRVENDSVIVRVRAFVECEVKCGFDFYVYDSFDKEDIKLTTNYKSTTEKFKTDVLLSFSCDLAADLDTFELEDIEVESCLQSAHFGDVEVEFEQEPEDEEEYEIASLLSEF